MGLKIHESVRIQAPPSDVWAFVADPILESVWNPKLVGVDRPSDGVVTLGERYRVTYSMSGRERTCDATVTELVPFRSITTSYTLEGDDRVSTVRFTLEADETGTGVWQTIDLGRMVPWFLVPLVWLVTRTGRPMETPYLETLRHTVEELAGVDNAPVV